MIKNIFHEPIFHKFFSTPAQENIICNANIELNHFLYIFPDIFIKMHLL